MRIRIVKHEDYVPYAEIRTPEGKKVASPPLWPVDFAPMYAARHNEGFEAKEHRLFLNGQYYIAHFTLTQETMKNVWYYSSGDREIFDVEMEGDEPFAIRSRKTGKVYRVMEQLSI